MTTRGKANFSGGRMSIRMTRRCLNCSRPTTTRRVREGSAARPSGSPDSLEGRERTDNQSVPTARDVAVRGHAGTQMIMSAALAPCARSRSWGGCGVGMHFLSPCRSFVRQPDLRLQSGRIDRVS